MPKWRRTQARDAWTSVWDDPEEQLTVIRPNIQPQLRKAWEKHQALYGVQVSTGSWATWDWRWSITAGSIFQICGWPTFRCLSQCMGWHNGLTEAGQLEVGNETHFEKRHSSIRNNKSMNDYQHPIEHSTNPCIETVGLMAWLRELNYLYTLRDEDF